VIEVTRKYARAYVAATKKVKGAMLDEFCIVTGLSRDRARHLLTATGTRPSNVARIDRRRAKPRKYSTDATRVLERVWVLSGCECGPYLAADMTRLLLNLEANGELAAGKGGYSPGVRAELEAMSGATIDRYLAGFKATHGLRGFTTTRPGPLLRTSIQIRKAGDEAEAEPGFLEVDTVAHCGPTLKGEFARSVSLTDVVTGWTQVIAIRNNARRWMLEALDQAIDLFPFPIQGLDCDNGSEFINHDVINWAGHRDIFFTRSRPYRKNDQATIEAKNNHIVRRRGFYYRYDTPAELALLNQLWPLVADRGNYFISTKKPVGWAADKAGHRKRLYDRPSPPLDRLLAAQILSPAQQADLLARREQLNLAELTRDITRIQALLIAAAKDKTDALYTSKLTLPSATKAIKTPRTA